MAISSLCALSFEELLIKFSNRTTEFVRILHALCQSPRGRSLYYKELIELAELKERKLQIKRKRQKLIREEKELDEEIRREALARQISLDIYAVTTKNIVAACAAFFILLGFFPMKAEAMTVSDPGSYGYYVQQLKEAQLQLAAAKEQIANQLQEIKVLQDTYKMATEQLKELNDIKDQVKGYYNQGKDLVGKIKSIKSQIEAVPNTLLDQGQAIMSIIGELGDFTNPEVALDKIFGDPRSPDYNPWETLSMKYEIRQNGLKNALNHSEKLLKGMKERFAGIEELTNKIDHTENIKEAQDLTNVLLTQIIAVLSEQLALQAQLGIATNLMDFSGVKDGELKRIESARESSKSKYEKAKSDYLAPYKEMESNGINVDNPSSSDLINIINTYGAK
ncbi:hypothetical protein [Maridesulfovibrio salexigens]|uniref:Uncharacterized protein n=1 Tax=Maridesulfovibrio salexigens (strain ATCC 14822 / DSM 2638 / NCIMB 8403 / VKM B-1763) TaxID=526222 RepID=C6BWD9_MARSD|nr:hypothetical protein [Maridesulfovibrio salexigens]ACS78383.1 hypothetical protein Desal_0316 [Maridesulfovibrio salexigens DSM 2638]